MDFARRKRPHRMWRARKAHVGELFQLDGSHHDWFEGRGPACVLMWASRAPPDHAEVEPSVAQTAAVEPSRTPNRSHRITPDSSTL